MMQLPASQHNWQEETQLTLTSHWLPGKQQPECLIEQLEVIRKLQVLQLHAAVSESKADSSSIGEQSKQMPGPTYWPTREATQAVIADEQLSQAPQ